MAYRTPSGRVIKAYRMFNGKKYSIYGATKSKTEVESWKKKLRNFHRYQSIRVTKSGSEYCVWYGLDSKSIPHK